MLFITTLLLFMYIQFADNAVVKDFFYLNNDNWKIIGNKNITDAYFRPFSMNGMLSNYIVFFFSRENQNFEFFFSYE